MFLRFLKSIPVFIGAYTIGSISYSNLSAAYNHFYRNPVNLPQAYSTQRHFLITGACEGLGDHFAREIAVKGIPLILISKDAESLTSLKKELESKFSAKVETIPFDFEKADLADYEALFSRLREFEISGLLNNSFSFLRKELLNSGPEDLLKILKCTVLPTVYFTHFSLNNSKTPPESRKLLSSTSSIIGAYPHPGFSLNSASAAFLSSFTRSLTLEKPKNIDIHLLEPGILGTMPEEIKENKRWRWFVSENDEVAEEIFRRMGHQRLIYGTFRHWVHHSLMRNGEKLVNYLNDGRVLNI